MFIFIPNWDFQLKIWCAKNNVEQWKVIVLLQSKKLLLFNVVKKNPKSFHKDINLSLKVLPWLTTVTVSTQNVLINKLSV